MLDINISQNAVFHICMVYEACKGDYSEFKKYCDRNNITYGLVLFYLNVIDNELREIRIKEHDYMYNKQIEEEFKIIPKKYTIVVNKDFTNEALKTSEEMMKHATDYMLDYFKQTTIASYKFEMLYCKEVLDRILTEIDLEIEEIE